MNKKTKDPDRIRLKFLGGAQTVTGSKTLIEFKGVRILIDCGLFQGVKLLRKLNWEPLSVDPSKIDYVILTHAHLDHSGYLPVLVRDGFKGVIYCTHPTREITEIILKDSAKIQEEDAARANRHLYTRHDKAKPLYTQKDAENVSRHFSSHNYDEWVLLSPDIKFQLLDAGHILGSSMIELRINNRTLIFSGDIGRKDPILLYPPKKITHADYLIMESTYGDRKHQIEDTKGALWKIIQETYLKGGILMIPSFSVERVQEIIFFIYQLKREVDFPNMPVYLDSPMGIDTTKVFKKYPTWQDLSKEVLDRMYDDVLFIEDYQQSKIVVRDQRPKIILAGSGMLQGGRILHYLNNHMGDEKNTLLFVGFQAIGTRGRSILKGSDTIKFFGEYHTVKCQIESISSLSAHADRTEMLEWMKNFHQPPKHIFLNHGEQHQLDSFRVWIKTRLGWKTTIPYLRESFELD